MLRQDQSRQNGELLTVTEAAAIMHLSPGTVRAIIKDGGLCARKLGRQYLIRKMEVIKMAKAIASAIPFPEVLTAPADSHARPHSSAHEVKFVHTATVSVSLTGKKLTPKALEAIREKARESGVTCGEMNSVLMPSCSAENCGR